MFEIIWKSATDDGRSRSSITRIGRGRALLPAGWR